MRVRSLSVLSILWVLSVPSAVAASARALVSQGNAAYAKGQYQEAIEAYDKASVDEPESAPILFDKGTVHYQLGDYGKAREAFEQAALKTKSLPLEARCQFNLGDCAFREAQRQADSDLQKALAGFQSSVRYYQEALKLDPQLKDAAYNIEVARLTLRTILDKLKKEQEKNKEQQQAQKEIVEKLAELIGRQKQAIDQNKALADQKPKEDDLQKKAGSLADDQKKLADDTRGLSKKMAQATPQPQPGQPPRPQQPPSPIDKAREHVDRSATEQAIAEEHLRKAKLDPARGDQEASHKELLEALAALTQPQPQNPDQGQNDRKDEKKDEKQGEKPQPKQGPQEQPKAQAKPQDEKARDILDEEKEHQRNRKTEAPAGYQSVDKDW
jgi:tetratricopeptide (TPR) repeat protein